MLKTISAAAMLVSALPLIAEETTLAFEPARTQINWKLDAALHTVHGTFQLRSGTVHFDTATGKASGAIIVDARSGQSGSESRDKRMHSSIIESTKFSEIVFRPDHVTGSVPHKGSATVQVHGMFELHGQPHEMTLPMDINVEDGRAIAVKSKFAVPYIEWGLKNPGTFVLRVGKTVEIDLAAEGHVNPKGTNEQPGID